MQYKCKKTKALIEHILLCVHSEVSPSVLEEKSVRETVYSEASATRFLLSNSARIEFTLGLLRGCIVPLFLIANWFLTNYVQLIYLISLLQCYTNREAFKPHQFCHPPNPSTEHQA